MTAPLSVSYVLPLRWTAELHPDLLGYLHWLADNVEKVIVVDGSPDPLFNRHRVAWSPYAEHIRPDDGYRFRNGKVSGVLTGVAASPHEKIVIADDDVRYEREGLERVDRLLDEVELVRPQNHFVPMPWHAVWDTARTLINRAFGADYPGTLGVRRSVLMATRGYDGDVLFENLELIRTVEAAGGRVSAPLDLFVERRPPDARHFWSQRVRQAYDEFAMPPRMALWLVLAPAAAVASRTSPMIPAAAAGTSVVLAEKGRRRAGGAKVFPFRASLAAPLWLAERSVTSWLAVGSRLVLGGIRYGGTTFVRAASSRRRLARLNGRYRSHPDTEEVRMARGRSQADAARGRGASQGAPLDLPNARGHVSERHPAGARGAHRAHARARARVPPPVPPRDQAGGPPDAGRRSSRASRRRNEAQAADEHASLRPLSARYALLRLRRGARRA